MYKVSVTEFSLFRHGGNKLTGITDRIPVYDSHNLKIPVFQSVHAKYNAIDLVKIILDAKGENICTHQPLRVMQSKVFLVDTSHFDHADDLEADDLGGWKNDGEHSRWVKVTKKGCKVNKVEFCSGKPLGDPRGYTLHRHYFTHHSNTEFKRKIIFLTIVFFH